MGNVKLNAVGLLYEACHCFLLLVEEQISPHSVNIKVSLVKQRAAQEPSFVRLAHNINELLQLTPVCDDICFLFTSYSSFTVFQKMVFDLTVQHEQGRNRFEYHEMMPGGQKPQFVEVVRVLTCLWGLMS